MCVCVCVCVRVYVRTYVCMCVCVLRSRCACVCPAAFLRKMDDDYSVNKGKRIQISVDLADPDAHVKWLKNGQEINPSAK